MDITQRLLLQHSDLIQEAYYTTAEDPTWDVTKDAAREIKQLRVLARKLAEFAKDQGADLGMWVDCGEISEEDYEMLKDVA
jgi:hypothetical protein